MAIASRFFISITIERRDSCLSVKLDLQWFANHQLWMGQKVRAKTTTDFIEQEDESSDSSNVRRLVLVKRTSYARYSPALQGSWGPAKSSAELRLVVFRETTATY